MRTEREERPARRPAEEGLAARRLLTFLLLLALSSGPLTADPWYQHYEKAERALAEERWRDAVDELNEALERRGDSGTRVRSYGMKVVDYHPYLKLGVAYYHLGLHEAALEAFETEERLGALAEAPQAREELDLYRRRATSAREQETAAPDPARAQALVARSLEEARTLAGQGQLDAAMEALGKGLALEPEHPESVALMDDLRQRAAARRRSEQQAAEASDLLTRARGRLTADEPQAAAALLRQVLALDAPLETPKAEARRLLSQAQEAIVASVEAERRNALVEQALGEAQRLAETGATGAALDRLEAVFAFRPDHPEALKLQRQLQQRQQEDRQDALVAEALAAAREALDAGRYQQAVVAANRALALDRSLAPALEVIRRAYQAISRQVLQGSSGENLPPAIRFADQRRTVDGVLAQVVTSPEIRLSGVVVDRSPVTLEASADSGAEGVTATGTSQAVGDLYVTAFTVEGSIPYGSSTFTLVATDGEGLSTRGEYAVLYRRPPSPYPWLFAGGAGLLLLAGAFAALRWRRRQRRLKRKFNPYLAGGPVFKEEMFFGREALVQRILQSVHNNSLLLHGERRIGKTSLLHQVRQRLEALDDPEVDFYPVYVDLQGTPEESFFATLADQTFEGLAALEGAPELEAGERTPALDRLPGYGHHDLVRELHGLIKALRKGSPKLVKLVLLIDEVDELNSYDPRVNQRLRSLFMKRFAENLVAVVAGVGIRKEWEKEGSPWYNFFEEIEVEAIDGEAARELVLRPIRGVFRVEAGVPERILEATGGKPYLIQRRCLALVNRLHEEGRRKITLADVDELERRQAS